MSKNVVARLRERIETRVRHGLDEVRLHIDTLSSLLDIAEAVAEEDPTEIANINIGPVVRCRWCHSGEHQGRIRHFAHCPYRRAREMCGKGDD